MIFWQEGVSAGQEESKSIGAAHVPHPQRSAHSVIAGEVPWFSGAERFVETRVT